MVDSSNCKFQKTSTTWSAKKQRKDASSRKVPCIRCSDWGKKKMRGGKGGLYRFLDRTDFALPDSGPPGFKASTGLQPRRTRSPNFLGCVHGSNLFCRPFALCYLYVLKATVYTYLAWDFPEPSFNERRKLHVLTCTYMWNTSWHTGPPHMPYATILSTQARQPDWPTYVCRRIASAHCPKLHGCSCNCT